MDQQEKSVKSSYGMIDQAAVPENHLRVLCIGGVFTINRFLSMSSRLLAEGIDSTRFLQNPMRYRL